jgi:hypothetical protein
MVLKTFRRTSPKCWSGHQIIPVSVGDQTYDAIPVFNRILLVHLNSLSIFIIMLFLLALKFSFVIFEITS